MDPLFCRCRRHEVITLLVVLLLILIELEASSWCVMTIRALPLEMIVPFHLELVLNEGVHLDSMVVVHEVVHLTWWACLEVRLI